MSVDHVNFFVPFEKAPAWHENQLTRALLVVLRYSPMAHQSWLQLVDRSRSLSELSPAVFATQRAQVLSSLPDLPDDEAIPGISVWLAPDAEEPTGPVRESDRAQVLDGIVTYGSDLVVVIENKINWGGVTHQPHQINLHGAPVVFKDAARPVRWQELVAVLTDLVERCLVAGAERLVIEDFLDLVEAHFPRIGPYTTLARCARQPFRIERRLDVILGEAVGHDEGRGPRFRAIPGARTMSLAHLAFTPPSSVELLLWPGDTLDQARLLYGSPEAVRAVVALQSKGWIIWPNFHWGHMAKGLAHTRTSISIGDYVEYWIQHIDATRQVKRDEWETCWRRLEQDGLVLPEGKIEFDRHFTRTQRATASPRPGLRCCYHWLLADAERLDSRGQLAKEVRDRIDQMLCSLGAPALGIIK